MTITDKDKGWNKIKKEVVKYKHAAIKVGIQSDAWNKKEKKDLRVAQYGAYNEYGHENIPERSFMRSTEAEQRDKWYGYLKKGLDDVLLNRKSVMYGLAIVGVVARDDIVQKITDIMQPPLSEETIKRKKNTKPLIETGTMRNSIKYVFVNV